MVARERENVWDEPGEFVAEKLRAICHDFVELAREKQNLDDCESMHYEATNAPNYRVAMVQLLYLLRYLPAYLAEYYQMYKTLLEKHFLIADPAVLSIGCGCGIDLWALAIALKDVKRDPRDLRWTGIDAVEWRHSDDVGLEAWFLTPRSIGEFDRLPEEDYNVILFPKSIGELSEDELHKLLVAMGRTRLSQGRIAVMASMTAKWREEEERSRLHRFSDELRQNHCYKLRRERTIFSGESDAKSVKSVHEAFCYPPSMLRTLSSLPDSLCGVAQSEGKRCADCRFPERTMPITTLKYFRYLGLMHEAR